MIFADQGHKACENKHIKIAEYLLLMGRRKSLRRYKWLYIFETGFEEMAEIMINNGAIMYNDWEDCLYAACLYKNIKYIKIILQYVATYIKRSDVINAVKCIMTRTCYPGYRGENIKSRANSTNIRTITLLVRSGADSRSVCDSFEDVILVSLELDYYNRNYIKHGFNIQVYTKIARKCPSYILFIGCRASKCYANKLPNELFRLLLEH